MKPKSSILNSPLSIALPKFSILNFALSITLLAVSANAEYLRDSTKEVVLDTSSGLMWQDNAVGSTMSWATAITTCEALELGGFSDWRLPNYNELYQLADRSRTNPAISPVFVNTSSSSVYWSATTNASDTSDAWYVDFSNGVGYWNDETYTYYVRCVRGGQ